MQDSAWIETGTYYGETTKILSQISNKIVSIEADQDLYNLAKKNFSNFKNIEVMFGRSEDKLTEALEKIKAYTFSPSFDEATENHKKLIRLRIENLLKTS